MEDVSEVRPSFSALMMITLAKDLDDIETKSSH